MRNLSLDTNLRRLSGAISAGTDASRVTSLAEVDTAGFTHAMVIVQLGTVASGGVLTVWAKSSNTSGSYGAGTVGDIGSVTKTDWANKFVIIDAGMLRQRYLRIDYQRTVANVAVEAILVVLYNATTAPATDANSQRTVVSGASPSTT